MPPYLRHPAFGLFACGIAATGALAQTTTTTITGDITVAPMNDLMIMPGDDVVITTTYTTGGDGLLFGTDPTLGDPALMFMLDIFADGTMTSRLGTPLTEADDFSAPSAPLYVLDNGALTDIQFGNLPLGPIDPSFSLEATTLNTETPVVDLQIDTFLMGEQPVQVLGVSNPDVVSENTPQMF